ncbi:site-2 protease family protein [bacterium]|nr:site-2 protease family protein [bacterium]
MESTFFIVLIVIFLFSIIIHEVSHGAMANYLGDPTAKMAGRLSLNPLRHLDPIGSVLLPLMLILLRSGIVFGWAKPVPINPFNFKDKKYGGAKVAVAGPAANISLAVVFGIVLRFMPQKTSGFFSDLGMIFSYIVWINLLLAIFNLIPIPPLDGSHILFTFLPARFNNLKIFLTHFGFFILIFFIFFFSQFLIPIINGAFNLIVGQPFI